MKKFIRFILILKQMFFLINCLFNNLYDISFLIDENNSIEDNKKENNSIEDNKKEKFRNLFFLKIIISIALISWFKLDTEQIGCLIISNMISELIETYIYYDEDEDEAIKKKVDDVDKK